MKKYFLILGVLVLLLGCTQKGDQANKLVVGMELAYPPFEMTDENGDPSGISVEFAKALGEYLHKDVEIQNMSFDGLIPALKTKKIDMIISSMTITDERKKSIDFSDPYSKSYLALLANTASGVHSISDIESQGKVLAVKRGTTGHIYAKEHLKNAKIAVFDKEHTCVLEVIQGKADGFIYDQMTIFKNWMKNKSTTTAYLRPFQKDFEYWGVGLRHNEDKLKKDINAFIAEYKANGGFSKLADKYLSEIKNEFKERNINFFF